jgi:hypothetical protein
MSDVEANGNGAPPASSGTILAGDEGAEVRPPKPAVAGTTSGGSSP